MKLTVKFRKVPPVVQNFLTGKVSVFYRGYKVGEVSDIKLSCDQTCIIFNIDISYQDLKLPTNTMVILKTQDIFGDRYLDLIYPQKPSKEILKNGDIIEGTSIYERLDHYLTEELETGELGALLSNLSALSSRLRKLSDKEFSDSAEDISFILKEIKGIVTDPEIKKEIKQTFRQTPALLEKTVKDLERSNILMEEIDQSIQAVDHSIKQSTTNIHSAAKSISTTNCQLDTLNTKVPVIPEGFICRTDKFLQKYDCIGNALGKTFSKNCLLFKLMFGRPGESFEECIEE